MKCHRRKKRILISLCISFLMSGCGNAIEEEQGVVQQEAVMEEEDVHEVGTNSEAIASRYEYCMLESDSAKILKYNGNEEVVFIPERLEGKEVSMIGEAAFQSNGEIKQAVLPAGIVTIEERAFEGCSELQYVFLNEEVREIGYRAFGDCNSLEEITFPEGMTDIRAGICEECTRLKKIVLPKSICFIDENAFSGCMELQLVYGESEFAEAFAEKEGKIYVDFGRIREEGNQVW